VFIQLAVEAGVGHSTCEAEHQLAGRALLGNSTQAGPCEAQYEAVSFAFNFGWLVSLVSLCLTGVMFDQYGGHTMGWMGAMLVCAGCAVMEIPLLGAQMGLDSSTYRLMFPAVMIMDIASMMNSFCILNFVYHFPGYEAFIISFVTAATQAASLLPVLLQFIMQWTGTTLSSAMAMYAVLAAVGGIACFVLVPRQAEYYEAARKNLGIPVSKSKVSAWKMLKNANAVVRSGWKCHLLFVCAWSLSVNEASLYTSFSADFGRSLFKGSGSASAQALPRLVNLTTAIMACTVAPYIAYWAKGPTSCLFLSRVCAAFLAAHTILVSNPSWIGQVVSCLFCVTFSALSQIALTRYNMAFAVPSELGAVQGVLFFYYGCSLTVLQGLTYMLMSFLPNDTEMRLVLLYQITGVIGAVSLTMWSGHMAEKGLPAPCMSPMAETQLVKPFGCKSIDDMLHIFHMNSREELLMILSSAGTADLVRVLRQIDFHRMASMYMGASLQDNLKKEDTETHGVAQHVVIEKEASKPGVGVCMYAQTQADVEHKGGSGMLNLMSMVWARFGACCQAGTSEEPMVAVVVKEISEPLLKCDAMAQSEAACALSPQELNVRIWGLLRSRRKVDLMKIYFGEKEELLWDAYCNLFEVSQGEEIEQFQDLWDDLLTEDEFHPVKIIAFRHASSQVVSM